MLSLVSTLVYSSVLVSTTYSEILFRYIFEIIRYVIIFCTTICRKRLWSFICNVLWMYGNSGLFYPEVRLNYRLRNTTWVYSHTAVWEKSRRRLKLPDLNSSSDWSNLAHSCYRKFKFQSVCCDLEKCLESDFHLACLGSEIFYNKHTCREVSPGLDAPSEGRWVREPSSHPRCVQSRTHRTCKPVWFLSHAISVLKNLRILVYNSCL